MMILGDFNADSSYVPKKKMKGIRIRSDKNFHWLIGDDIDTTASNQNDNTYDRIVVYGDDMLQAVVPNSAKPFNFQKAFGLTDKQALKVSDHYPVEVELKSSKTQAATSGAEKWSQCGRAKNCNQHEADSRSESISIDLHVKMNNFTAEINMLAAWYKNLFWSV